MPPSCEMEYQIGSDNCPREQVFDLGAPVWGLWEPRAVFSSSEISSQTKGAELFNCPSEPQRHTWRKMAATSQPSLPSVWKS